MKIFEYSDEEHLDEVKHRGFLVEPQWHYRNGELCCENVKIGGVVFEVNNYL